MQRRALSIILLLVIPSYLKAAAQPPNFVLIVAADLGYGYVGATGALSTRRHTSTLWPRLVCVSRNSLANWRNRIATAKSPGTSLANQNT